MNFAYRSILSAAVSAACAFASCNAISQTSEIAKDKTIRHERPGLAERLRRLVGSGRSILRPMA